MEKSFRGVFLIILLVILLIVFVVILSLGKFNFKKIYEPSTALSKILPRFRLIDMEKLAGTSDKNQNGSVDAVDILRGAKK
ncbi:MAG: hypothetical protein NTZ89_01620, partial [Actinobacteria bacterium]|nr:hypothetical protein [Actinomycetota bacterium]